MKSLSTLQRQLGELVNDPPMADWFKAGHGNDPFYEPFVEPVEETVRPVNSELWDRPSKQAMAEWEEAERKFEAAWQSYQKHRNPRRYRAECARLREMEE